MVETCAKVMSTTSIKISFVARYFCIDRRSPKQYSVLEFLRLLTLCGCLLIGSSSPADADNISQIIGRYDAGLQQSMPAIKAFYLHANDFQREIYFDDLVLDSKREMGLKKDNKATPLLQKFSDKDIQARVFALSLLANYSKALVQLSDPTKGKTAEADLRSIGNRISSISLRLGAVAKAAPGVGPYALAAGELAGLATKYWTQLKQEAALRETIREGAPQVEKLLSLLAKDVSIFSEGIYENSAETTLGAYLNYYNNHFVEQSADNSEAMTASRLEYLRRAQVAASRYATALPSNPNPALVKMCKVNHDLLDWATAPKKTPFNLNQLADDTDSYLDDADTLIDATTLVQSAR